jgi:glycosyltransferase involved in cell wall biosynthesis
MAHAQSARPLTVAIVYNFLAHYRDPVLECLQKNEDFNYILVADDKAEPGSRIPLTKFLGQENFILARAYYFLKDFVVQPKVVLLALRTKIDIYIFLGDVHYLTTWLAAAIARVRGARVYFWTHGWTRKEHGAVRIVRKLFYRIAHGLLLYGTYARSIGLREGFASTKLHVIYNSLDYQTHSRLRETLTREDLGAYRTRLFAHPEYPTVITLGRLIPGRKTGMLLDALELLLGEAIPVNLLVVGGGPELDRLQERAKRSSVDAFFFGDCYDEEILARLILLSDVAAVPGCIGLTAVHVLSYGKPIIVPDTEENQGPEWEAVIPNVNGDHFKADDTVSLAMTIKKWVYGPVDWERVRRSCISGIEAHYTPAIETRLIEHAICGGNADDVIELRTMVK